MQKEPSFESLVKIYHYTSRHIPYNLDLFFEKHKEPYIKPPS
jgi:hypothetical protein